MTHHTEVQNVPSDADILALADETRAAEQAPNGGFMLPLTFARALLAKYGAPLGPLTLSLSPDPRGVHVAVHQGSECVHAEAMALPAMDAVPLFWYRPRGSDGLYEGPIHRSAIERVRKESDGWVPLYAQPAPQAAQGDPAAPKRYSFVRQEATATWLVTDPTGDRWVAFDGTPAGRLVDAMLAATPDAQPAQGVTDEDVVQIFADVCSNNYYERTFIDVSRDEAIQIGRRITTRMLSGQARAALSNSPMEQDVRDAFDTWFYGSKYAQVVSPSPGTRQAALDGWNASRAALSTPLMEGDALDAERYRAWRDAAVSNNDSFAQAMKEALPPEARTGKPRWPTADEWSEAIDAAIASMGSKGGEQS